MDKPLYEIRDTARARKVRFRCAWTDDGTPFIWPLPCRALVPMYEGVRVMRLNRKGKEPLFLHCWPELKDRCADVIGRDVIAGVDKLVAQCADREKAQA